MKLTALSLLLLCCSCASTNYWQNRQQDTKDIFTISLGTGLGAKGRVGPFILTPIHLQNDSLGLRGGEYFTDIKGVPKFMDQGITDTGILFFGGDIFGSDHFQFWPHDQLQRLHQRGKSFHSQEIPIPFIQIPRNYTDRPPNYSYYGQVEGVVALGTSLRLGVNFFEAADWLLGWTTFDLLNDDYPYTVPTTTEPTTVEHIHESELEFWAPQHANQPE